MRLCAETRDEVMLCCLAQTRCVDVRCNAFASENMIPLRQSMRLRLPKSTQGYAVLARAKARFIFIHSRRIHFTVVAKRRHCSACLFFRSYASRNPAAKMFRPVQIRSYARNLCASRSRCGPTFARHSAKIIGDPRRGCVHQARRAARLMKPFRSAAPAMEPAVASRLL